MLEGLVPPINERLCIIGNKSAELSKEDLQILNDALANPLWTHNALAVELSRRGFQVGRDAINKHRAKGCLCFRD